MSNLIHMQLRTIILDRMMKFLLVNCVSVVFCYPIKAFEYALSNIDLTTFKLIYSIIMHCGGGYLREW
jgi:hypothetical protein